MPEARYRPLYELTSVEREVERMRQRERPRVRRSRKRGYMGLAEGDVGPETIREADRMARRARRPTGSKFGKSKFNQRPTKGEIA